MPRTPVLAQPAQCTTMTVASGSSACTGVPATALSVQVGAHCCVPSASSSAVHIDAARSALSVQELHNSKAVVARSPDHHW
eukprot:11768-Heterococcus_DN1.PRE.2